MIDPKWKDWLQGFWEQDPHGEPHVAIVFRAVPMEESPSPRLAGGGRRRGRPHVAMELKSGDKLVWHSFSRGDKPLSSEGTWRLVEGVHTRLELSLEGAPPRSLEILRLDDHQLVLGPTDA